MSAVCDPTTLASQAKCFYCLPPAYRGTVDVYLLNQIANTGKTPAQLMTAAAAFQSLTPHLALAAKVYLLARATSTSTVASVLEAASACYNCIPTEMIEPVQTYLYANSAGGATDTAALLRAAGSYQSLAGREIMIEVYLLAQIAGITNVQTIVAGAKCLLCLSPRLLERIILYLACKGFAMSLIPNGSVYTGATPEFDLAVSANTTYIITWGANELSVTICGNSYPSTGVGTQTIVWTASCTLMQFFGTFAGTTVTAVVTQPLPGSKTPEVSGFTFTISRDGTTVTASWDTPPSFVDSTEVWVSSDNVTFALQTTVAAPGTSATFAAPGAATQTYCKVRWVDSGASPANGAFNTALVAYGAVANWAARILTNGAIQAIAQASVNAANTFYGKIVAIGLSKFKIMSLFVPEGIGTGDNGSFTPLIKAVGSDPWPKISGTYGTTDINGYTPFPGTGAAISTGLVPNTHLTAGNYGATIYLYRNINSGTQRGAFGSAANSAFNLGDAAFHMRSNLTQGAYIFMPSFNAGTGFNPANLPSNDFAGYFSVNRVASNDMRLYVANSTLAHQQLAVDLNNNVTALPLAALTLFAVNCTVGGIVWTQFDDYTTSFFAVHEGLSSAQSLALYNAVQQFLVDKGGGFR